MVVALSDEHKVRFYASLDLKQWTQLSAFGVRAMSSEPGNARIFSR